MSSLNHKLEAAKKIAREAHASQVDKAGVDYFIGHLSSVANSCENELEKIVGYLHDVAEDTEINESEVCNMLRNSGLFEEGELTLIETALKTLNQKNHKNRNEYILAIKGNKLATMVKLKDLENNMNLKRLQVVTIKDIERVERYKREYNFLRDIM